MLWCILIKDWLFDEDGLGFLFMSKYPLLCNYWIIKKKLKKKKIVTHLFINFYVRLCSWIAIFTLEYVHEPWDFEICKICCWIIIFCFWINRFVVEGCEKYLVLIFFIITMHIFRFEFWLKLWNLLLVIPFFLLNIVMKKVIINWLTVNVIDQEFNTTLLPIH